LSSSKKTGLLLILLVFSNLATAQSVSALMGARSAALGYASATLSDEWALFNNIGGISRIDHPNVAFAYDARPVMPGADRIAATLSTPIKMGVAGFGLFRFGDDLYSEQIISAGYGNHLGLVSLGLKINYIQYRAEGFGTRNALSLNFGGIAQITPQIAVGAYIVNLNQPRLSASNLERLPTHLIAGLSFKPVEKFLLVTEIEKDLDYDPTFKAGMEYLAHKKITLRTGFNLHPNAGFFGLGYTLKNIKIDYSLQHSTTLSFACQASVIYRVSKKKRPREK